MTQQPEQPGIAPDASAAELYQLAQSRADLRPQIAEHPNAYQGLLDWLGGLGDPRIDAALARRAAGDDAAREPEQPTVPIEGQLATPVTEQPTQAMPQTPPAAQTEEFGAVQQPQAPHPATEPEPASAFDQQVYGAPAYAAQQPAYQQPVYPAQNDPQQAGYLQQHPVYDPEEEAEPRKKRGGAGILIFLLVLLTAGALAASYFLLFGNPFADDDEPAAEQEQTAPEPTEDPEEAEETTEEEAEEPEADEPTEITSIPAPTQDENTVEVPENVEGVEYSHSGTVEIQEGETLTVTAEPESEEYTFADGVETSWDFEYQEPELERPLPDNALDITEFSSPTGNINCELTEDEVRCTVLEYDFDAPSECEDGATFRVDQEGEAEFDCENPVSSHGEELDYDEITGNEDFGCQADFSYFECWSQHSGSGFEIAREYFELH